MGTVEVKALDAGSWFGSNISGYRVPTLQEFITCILDNNLNLQLELKELPGREHAIADSVCRALKDMWSFQHRGLFLSGFSERCLKRVAQNLADVPRAIALLCVPEDPDAYAREAGVQIIHVQDKFVDTEALDAIRHSEVEFGVATINDPERAKQLLAQGVTSVLTDDPLLLENEANHIGQQA
ncbi:MAG: glycerophosphoryl diester phosphodiesterase [Hyphomicrobiales bacterium]|nr:glycerophosphoryl diester phosphodiesterase [Hyphomicrobiales bacterium]MCP4997474.1 glycerophosphoryl diester phosphodiesterase [Hyphomicrobiales bacterium]